MRLFLLLTLGLIACGGASTGSGDEEDTTKMSDDDGDGLTNGDEVDLGLNPDEADTDGDGLEDGDELDIGTNPLFEFSVPLEEGDYVLGTCPTVPDQSVAGPTGMGRVDYDGDGDYDGVTSGGQFYAEEWAAYVEGDTVLNWAGMDVFEQDVSVYNFCGNYTLVTVSAAWCGPCQAMAAEMADEMDELSAEIGNFTYFELLSQNVRYGEPNANQLGQWQEEFALDGIPVVGPQDADQTAGIAPWDLDGGIPTTYLLSPEGVVLSADAYLTSTRNIKALINRWEEGR